MSEIGIARRDETERTSQGKVKRSSRERVSIALESFVAV